MGATLRLHALADPDPYKWQSSHAWLSLEKDDQTTTYGMQPKTSGHVSDEQRDARTSTGEATCLFKNCDDHWEDRGQVLREKELSPQELKRFEAWTEQKHDYHPAGNNCAHAARDGWEVATGEHYEIHGPIPDNVGGFISVPCPGGLIADVDKQKAAQVDADFDHEALPEAKEKGPESSKFMAKAKEEEEPTK